MFESSRASSPAEESTSWRQLWMLLFTIFWLAKTPPKCLPFEVPLQVQLFEVLLTIRKLRIDALRWYPRSETFLFASTQRLPNAIHCHPEDALKKSIETVYSNWEKWYKSQHNAFWSSREFALKEHRKPSFWRLLSIFKVCVRFLCVVNLVLSNSLTVQDFFQLARQNESQFGIQSSDTFESHCLAIDSHSKIMFCFFNFWISHLLFTILNIPAPRFLSFMRSISSLLTPQSVCNTLQSRFWIVFELERFWVRKRFWIRKALTQSHWTRWGFDTVPMCYASFG